MFSVFSAQPQDQVIILAAEASASLIGINEDVAARRTTKISNPKLPTGNRLRKRHPMTAKASMTRNMAQVPVSMRLGDHRRS